MPAGPMLRALMASSLDRSISCARDKEGMRKRKERRNKLRLNFRMILLNRFSLKKMRINKKRRNE